jgi:predicted dithiol-disulfide oxidoreductase (DUF899 family)
MKERLLPPSPLTPEHRMTPNTLLRPAGELANTRRRFPNESPAYRDARRALLAEEIELRRHVERVAAQRRALPLGGEVPQDYLFVGEQGPVRLTQLFGKHDTLVTYNWMFGVDRESPCPMCTSQLAALDGEVPDILQRVAFAVVATSPIERLVAFKRERGWQHLPVFSSGGNTFNRDYADEVPGSGEDNSGFNVFRKDGDRVFHTYGDEMGFETADPGEDPRGPIEMMPLWNVLDLTPGGRGTDWYPKLAY